MLKEPRSKEGVLCDLMLKPAIKRSVDILSRFAESQGCQIGRENDGRTDDAQEPSLRAQSVLIARDPLIHLEEHIANGEQSLADDLILHAVQSDHRAQTDHVDPQRLTFGQQLPEELIDQFSHQLPLAVLGFKKMTVLQRIVGHTLGTAVLHHVIYHRLDKVLLASKVIADGVDLDPGAPGDVPHRDRVKTILREKLSSGLDESLLRIF